MRELKVQAFGVGAPANLKESSNLRKKEELIKWLQGVL
jgi:hypothetical protein